LLPLESPYILRRLSDSLCGIVWLEFGFEAAVGFRYTMPFDKCVLELFLEGLRGEKFAVFCTEISNLLDRSPDMPLLCKKCTRKVLGGQTKFMLRRKDCSGNFYSLLGKKNLESPREPSLSTRHWPRPPFGCKWQPFLQTCITGTSVHYPLS
jgi:hypothetical protein